MTDNSADIERIRDQALELVLRLATQPEDEALRRELAAWRRQSPEHDKAYRVAAEAWLLGGGADNAETRDASPGEAPSAANTNSLSGGRPRRRAALVAVSTAAAVVLAVLVWPILRLHVEADYRTGVAEVETVELEDGSTLDLDAESAVSVAYSARSRGVELLAGSAFFDVRRQPDRPFLVGAASLRIEVTGTAFAVSRGGGSTTVAVASGTVVVRPAHGAGMAEELGQGDLITLDESSGVFRKGTVLPTEIAAWRRGLVLADRMPFGDLVRQLDRHHRGAIWLASGALAGGDVTGVFDLSDPVSALIAAADTQDADVTQLSPFLLVVTAR